MNGYKTQVLLLHSEQNALDDLRAGFNDKYTVHCATSGSEALNTLVDTPINILISAQELPGMSGLDALREAKKRSPDTVGILLVGDNSAEIEALVGDEEVFQVVSGNVTGAGLLQLVDKATKKGRLMALAESANDTAANVDDPAEYVIMETAEDGATVISDGTGRLPVLDAKKMEANESPAQSPVHILVVSKDFAFFESIQDSCHGSHDVHNANTLAQAEDAIGKYKVGVVIVDAGMVGGKIEQLTQHLQTKSKRLVSIVAGRRDDGEMLLDLINRGKVYRFLLKPVSPGRVRLAVEASVKHHLEAPNSAFASSGAAANRERRGSSPRRKEQQRRQAKVANPAPPPAQAEAGGDPTIRTSAQPILQTEIDDGLVDAFATDDSRFAESVTGLIASVSKKLSEDNPSRESHETRRSSAGGSSSTIAGLVTGKLKFVGIAAAAIVVVGVAWFSIGSEEAPEPQATTSSQPQVTPQQSGDSEVPSEPLPGTPSFTETDVQFEKSAAVTETDASSALIEEARAARDAGRLHSPVGDNAVELFAAAMATDPDNSLIAAELDAVIGQVLAVAETAMLEQRLGESNAALQRVATVDPANSRLPFLQAQLSQMLLRGHLDDARLAIREMRFEDAATSLGAARRLGISDTSEIDAVFADLRTARSEQQVDDVLARATERLEAGFLLSPPNDNARYYYELVLSNDAENPVARQGLSFIAGTLALQARAQIDSGDLAAAESSLSDARSLDPDNAEITSITAAIVAARTAIAEQQRIDQLASEAEAARQAEAERVAEAERMAAVEAQAETEQQLATEPPAVVDPVATEENATEAMPLAVGDDMAEAAIAEPTQPGAVAMSSLVRTKYVAPKYPRSAQRRELSGWVDLVFTVTSDGSVADVMVKDSEPSQIFANAAIRAVQRWEFEPVFENGTAVAKRTGVRMMFALE